MPHAIYPDTRHLKPVWLKKKIEKAIRFLKITCGTQN